MNLTYTKQEIENDLGLIGSKLGDSDLDDDTIAELEWLLDEAYGLVEYGAS